jgi:hypothetical protein
MIALAGGLRSESIRSKVSMTVRVICLSPKLDLTHASGVPSIPPQFLGYRHFARAPLYFIEGCLYHVPASESERDFFKVHAEPTENLRRNLQHPRGGHNYYNNRDMERVLRTMVLLQSTGLGEPDWDGYEDRLSASGESILP